MNYGFVINNETCIGCHACSTACKSENEVPLGVNRTWVKSVETGYFPDVTRHFQVTRCNHCEKPPCVDICPVSAMYQRPDGIVEFDGDACIGCKACLQACPYDAVYIDPSTGTAAKCHYCAHRLDVGLEPACVVVCPEHSIIAGDMDDPDTEISRTLARQKVTVRKPEKGTSPNVFYIGGEDAAMDPNSTERTPTTFAWADTLSLSDGQPIRTGGTRLAEQMVQVVYNAQHKVPWHWQVPAYLVTKGIAAGAFLLLALGTVLDLFPIHELTLFSASLTALVFLGLTTALLVFDLEHPERFLRILTRPQWKSWLTKGAVILIAFSTICTGWALIEFGALQTVDDTGLGMMRLLLFWLGIPLAIGVAIYTAFLFGQAQGRDLWQSTLLPVHLLVQSILAGSACLLIVSVFTVPPPELVDVVRTFAIWSILIDLGMMLLGEFGMQHASESAARAALEIRAGRYKTHFWIGSVAVGHVIALILVVLAGPLLPLGSALAIIGLYYYEYAFVMAPQEIPNS
jgi:Fe-S-cluster-containing dehydrogenase component/formate-dependent nitrite reductase membrane component NrfD